jgi:hypothetical protein
MQTDGLKSDPHSSLPFLNRSDSEDDPNMSIGQARPRFGNSGLDSQDFTSPRVLSIETKLHNLNYSNSEFFQMLSISITSPVSIVLDVAKGAFAPLSGQRNKSAAAKISLASSNFITSRIFVAC